MNHNTDFSGLRFKRNLNSNPTYIESFELDSLQVKSDYNYEDVKDLKQIDFLPGVAPYLRGP